MMLLLAAASGCSKTPQSESTTTKEGQAGEAQTAQKSMPAAPQKNVVAPLETQADAASDVSRVIAKTDVTEAGKPTCKIDFVYAGSDPEDLYWDGEKCSNVRARLVDQAELQKLRKWERLQPIEKRFVTAMPGGKVLYVESGPTASIYPVGTTNMSYEISVGD